MNARGYYSEIFVQIPFVIEGPPPPAGPHISVEPAAGVPGETLTFTASGYRPEEEISFWISAPYQDTPVYSSIRKHAASGNGWITIPWTIPETAVTGRWRLVMFGDKSELEQFIDFDVIEPGAPEPVTDYVEPSTGPAGTTFRFYAAGFKPGELLEYWLTSPEGETVSDNIPVYANNQGGVVLQWASPADTVGGQWMITIQGARHLHEVILEFVVQGPQATPAPTEYATPPAGKPGTTFTFFAEGFESGAVVGWWATSPTGEVLQGGIDVTANRQGELRWSWTAPDNAMPGAWMMTAESKESLFQKTIWFEILPPDVAPTPTPAPSGVTPSAGPPGTTFTFETSELMPGENVGYWVTAPDRSIYPSPNNGEYNPNADEQGRLVLQWTAPEDAMPGEWMMVIQSAPTDQVNVEANSLVTIPFYIGY
jgi:hypothetical protein